MKQQTIVALIFVLVFGGSILSAEEKKETFSGRVVDAAGAIPGVSAAYLTVTIEKYNTPEEIAALAKLLAEEGQDALLKKIEKMEVGRIRIGNRLSYPLCLARSIDIEGKRVIRAMTDRPIPIVEAFRQSRSMDYPFGFVQLTLNSEGKGEGVLVVATKLEFKEGKLEMESYGHEPFRLMNITTK
jgi:hypothetical protein